MGSIPKEIKMKLYHDVRNVHFFGEYIILMIDGNEKSFKVNDISSSLEQASEKEKSTFEISPSGYGIYWPLIDEDISIDGLLGISHTREPQIKSA
jgi:hypothetical protein